MGASVGGESFYAGDDPLGVVDEEYQEKWDEDDYSSDEEEDQVRHSVSKTQNLRQFQFRDHIK